MDRSALSTSGALSSSRIRSVRESWPFRATCDGDKERLLELLHTYGFVDPDVDLTADEAYEWWAMSAGPVLAPQPHTYVPPTAPR